MVRALRPTRPRPTSPRRLARGLFPAPLGGPRPRACPALEAYVTHRGVARSGARRVPAARRARHASAPLSARRRAARERAGLALWPEATDAATRFLEAGARRCEPRALSAGAVRSRESWGRRVCVVIGIRWESSGRRRGGRVARPIVGVYTYVQGGRDAAACTHAGLTLARAGIRGSGGARARARRPGLRARGRDGDGSWRGRSAGRRGGRGI